MNFKEAMQKGVEWGSVIMQALLLHSLRHDQCGDRTDRLAQRSYRPHPQRPAVWL